MGTATARSCMSCKRPATMVSTNVNTNGQWYFCTIHMAEAVALDRERVTNYHQYVWPIAGPRSATRAQLALYRCP